MTRITKNLPPRAPRTEPNTKTAKPAAPPRHRRDQDVFERHGNGAGSAKPTGNGSPIDGSHVDLPRLPPPVTREPGPTLPGPGDGGDSNKRSR